MGLGLVGIDELSLGLASTQILVLQPRPYETEDVFGSITVEFVFIEGAPIEVRRQEAVPQRPARHIAQSPGTLNGTKSDFSFSSSTASPSDSSELSSEISLSS